MKSNSCSWMLIENCWLELWLNFCLFPSDLRIFLLMGEQNNREELFTGGKLLIISAARAFLLFLVCWRNWIKDLWDSKSRFSYIKEIGRRKVSLPGTWSRSLFGFQFSKSSCFSCLRLCKHLRFISISVRFQIWYYMLIRPDKQFQLPIDFSFQFRLHERN